MRYLFLLFCLSSLVIRSQTRSVYEGLSQEVFEALKKNKPENIESLFDTTGIGKIIKAQSLAVLSDLRQNGKVKKLLGYWEEQEGCKTRTAMLIHYRRLHIHTYNDTSMLYIVFNERKQIQQISVGKPTQEPFYILKGYKGLAEVTDLYTSFKTQDGLTLEGNITFSDTTKKKLPLVIFVHGSGPSDRDETIGPNKPFRDLAQGLSQKGIAGFRYDKRTYAYQFNMKPRSDSMTLYHEVIADALDAVRKSKQFTFIDTNRIFIVGHSLGASYAPEIARLDPSIKGLVMLAGTSRPYYELLPEQVKYMASLDDSISTQEQMQITSVNWMVDKIGEPTPDSKSKAMYLGASAIYWNSVKEYNQAKTARKLSIPLLFMNGERDYQVNMSEFDLWKKALLTKQNVTFKSYPKLTHLLMEGEGKPDPKEYDKPSHVPQYVIDDIADFILSH